METRERRVVLDESFERAIVAVLDALMREGLKVHAIDAGDLHNHAAPGAPLRFAMLEASLLDLRIPPAPAGEEHLGCRLSVYELTGSCTLLTAEDPAARHPLAASLEPRLIERIGNALRQITRGRPCVEAA
jgi:hypothetical protein